MKERLFRYGEILGHVDLGSVVTSQASKFAAEHYKAEEATSFSGDPVEVFATPVWAPSREAWVPVKRLAELGLQLTKSRAGEEMVVTLGVDQHVDSIHRDVLCLVLHNDGLTFRQGGVSHKPVGGDWFIFNDHANHGVREAKGAAVFAALVLPLEEI